MAGGQSRRAVELLDIYPTLIELCGLPANPKLEGRSLVPLLKNPAAEWTKGAVTSNGADKISVRTERWRYSRFPDGDELYDHQKDPNEWTNLAHGKHHAALKKQLAALLPPTVSMAKLRQFSDLSPEEKQQIRKRPRG